MQSHSSERIPKECPLGVEALGVFLRILSAGLELNAQPLPGYGLRCHDSCYELCALNDGDLRPVLNVSWATI